MGQKAENTATKTRTRTRKTAAQRATEAAAADPGRQNGVAPGDIITLSSGIKLRISRVPPLTIREVSMRVERPTAPTVYIEEKGRDEENVQDPDYKKALEEYEAVVGLAVSDAVLLLGTALVEVPDGVCGPDDDGWVEDLRVLGVEIDADNPRIRYLRWLKLYAFKSDEDMVLALAAPMLLAGVREEDVVAAMDSFRDSTMGRTDLGSDPP